MRLHLFGGLMLATWAGRAAAVPAGPPLPIPSKTTPAQQMIALYRDQYAHHVFRPCLPARVGEILVCGSGRGGSAERLPLPDERGAPDGPRGSTGDLPSGAGALASTDARTCREGDCSSTGAVSLLAVAAGAVQVVRAIVDPEGASDHADRQPRH
jgi:hypothetical protein